MLTLRLTEFSWFRSMQIAAIAISFTAILGTGVGCDIRMSTEEIQQRNQEAFTESIKAEDERNRWIEDDENVPADPEQGDENIARDEDADRRGFLEDDRRREARERLEHRNKLERGKRPKKPSGDEHATKRRPIESRKPLERENESYKRQGPEGKTYLEDTRRSEQRARQEARNKYYRENPQ